jgi:hypothetical protein
MVNFKLWNLIDLITITLMVYYIFMESRSAYMILNHYSYHIDGPVVHTEYHKDIAFGLIAIFVFF